MAGPVPAIHLFERKMEMPAKTPFYITTAISYPNGPPHIGHAYEAIATDAIARFMRLDGYDVYFLTGTDEHGQKMQQTAARAGLTARQLRDRNVPLFEKMVARLAEVWERVNQAARDAAEYNLERKPLVFNVFGLLAEATRG